MDTDNPAARVPYALDRRRTVFFDVENSSRAQHIAVMLAYLGLPDGLTTRVSAIGNWRVVSVETAHLLSHAGAELIHSAPAIGVKDWSDLRIAVDAGRWLGQARAGDVLEIVSDDQAFDAVGDLAASLGVIFRRIVTTHIGCARGSEGAENEQRKTPATETVGTAPQVCRFVDALAGLRARVNEGGSFVLLITRRNPLTRVLIGRWWASNLYTVGELAESFQRAGFSRVAFRSFPPAARYLSAWGHIVEATR